MKEKFRKSLIAAIITSCIIYGFVAACKAYSGIRRIGYGEQRAAFEIVEDEIKFFDYTF